MVRLRFRVIVAALLPLLLDSFCVAEKGSKASLGAGLDKDGDGALSGEEVSQSGLFAVLDANGDGTVHRNEIRRFIDASIGGDDFDDHDEIREGVSRVMSSINKNSESGIQRSELRDHWESIAARMTVESVALWVEHGLRLPQHAERFRANAISGFDLPSVIEDSEAYFDALGVRSSLHKNQLLRGINMLLLNLAKSPSPPVVRCWVDEQGSNHVVWSPKFMCEADHGESALCIPVHKWRLYKRASSLDTWTFVEEFPPGQKRFAEKKQSHVLRYRLEAWNLVGFGAARASCKPISTPEEEAMHQGSSSSSSSPIRKVPEEMFAQLFLGADEDGDGDIEAEELLEYYQRRFGERIFRGDKKMIRTAVENTMNMMDHNSDDKILKSDVARHWQSATLRSLASSQKVADWIRHSVLLPQYASAFYRTNITGYDFPSLIEEDRKMLRTQIGVSAEIHLNQIVRSIQMVLLAVATAPRSPILNWFPSQENCGEVVLMWSGSGQDALPPHKYRLSRRIRSDEKTMPWHCIYDGMEQRHTDVVSAKESSVYEYKIEAWNMIGVSAETPGSVAAVHLSTMYGEGGCSSTHEHETTWWITRWILYLILLPFRILLLIIDNHYRITGVFSIGFIVMSWAKLSPKLKSVLYSAFHSRVMPPALKGYFAAPPANGAPGHLLGPIEPLTPTSKALREAARLAFRSRRPEALKLGNGSSTNVAIRSAGDTNIIAPIPRSASGMSVASEMSASDLSTSSSVSVDAEGKRKKSKWRLVRRAFLRRRKGKAARLPQSPPKTPPAALGTPPETPETLSVKRCMICQTTVSGFYRWKRHHCRFCQGIYCNVHTKHQPHMPMMSCGVNSKCICVNCYDARIARHQHAE